MKDLYGRCRAKLKIWKEFPDGSHNDTIAEEGYFEAIRDFIEQYVLKTEKLEAGKLS
jgi:hypothetical protein